MLRRSVFILALLRVAALRQPAAGQSRRCVLVHAACATTTAILPRSCVAAPADDVERLTKALGLLEELTTRWPELTTDCRYGEMRRELLSAENKERLLVEASSTSKASSTITVCKTSGVAVRRVLGTTADSSLSRLGGVLERPAVLQRVPDDRIEDYQGLSERLQQALAAADVRQRLPNRRRCACTALSVALAACTDRLRSCAARCVAE